MINIEHIFVKKLPENNELKSNIMYINDYNCICKHLCFCGCGKVILECTDTPNKGLIYDFNSNTISFDKKFFNMRLECQSLYSITNNTVNIISSKTINYENTF